MFNHGNIFPAHAEKRVGNVSVPKGAITFDSFKKMFYPQLYLIREEPQTDDERDLNDKKRELEMPNHSENLQERILKLDKYIRERLGT